ncbi:MAG: hypothetical protein JJU00_12885 [Opitutales bacterium]|nr:hypothetical protein [Opitutales bacterium]
MNIPASILLHSDPEVRAGAACHALNLAKNRQNTSVGCGGVPCETDQQIVFHHKSIIDS